MLAPTLASLVPSPGGTLSMGSFLPGAGVGLLAQSGELPWMTQVLLGLAALVLAAIAFVAGQLWQRLRDRGQRRARENQMFQIEKALADFFEHDKGKLNAQLERLREENRRLEQQVDEYRRRAAGVTGKKGKDGQADLLLQLLVENEQLQERLYEQHAREKDERDRMLAKELAQISYQRVLLSRLLEDRGVQEAVVEVLADEGRVERLRSDLAKGAIGAPEEPDRAPQRAPDADRKQGGP